MADIFDPWEEKRIASDAEILLERAMRSKISSLGFKEHVSENKAKLENAESIAKTNLGKFGENRLKLYLNGLALRMGSHGFVHHYGVSGIREDKKGRTRKIPRTTHYNFKNHVFKLPAKDYIDDAIKQSQVIPYVMENLTRIRSKEIFVQLKNFIEKE